MKTYKRHKPLLCYNESGDSMQILLVEDNLNIVKGLKYAFSQTDYIFNHQSCYNDALTYISENNNIDLIILDIILSDGSGINLYKDVIKEKNIPVIFLTAQDDEETIVDCLDMGAEDYLTKPFSTKELLARINKILARSRKKSLVKVKDITFDLDKMLVCKNEEEITLTSLEREILYLLFLNINKVVERNQILDVIWEKTGNDVDEHTVTVYIKRIKDKIGPGIIKTIKGLGYRIDEE